MRLLVSIGVLALALTGCSSSGGDSGADEAVTYVGNATDEALERLLDRTATSNTSRVVTWVTPSDGDTLSADSPATFELSDPALARTDENPTDENPTVAPVRVRVAHRSKSRSREFTWFGLVGVAHAHGTPFNGTGYYVRVADDGGRERLAVFTDQTTVTPTDAAWEDLAGAPQPLTLSVSWAEFENNDIPEDSGPYAGDEVSFRIE